MKIYNEFWFSFVLWKWNWLLCSYEIEEWESEIRWFWFKKLKKFNDIYIRIWIFKSVFIFSKNDWFKYMKKNKIALKFILWFSN